MGHSKDPEQKSMGGFNKHGLQSSCQVHKVVLRHWHVQHKCIFLGMKSFLIFILTQMQNILKLLLLFEAFRVAA